MDFTQWNLGSTELLILSSVNAGNLRISIFDQSERTKWITIGDRSVKTTVHWKPFGVQIDQSKGKLNEHQLTSKDRIIHLIPIVEILQHL